MSPEKSARPAPEKSFAQRWTPPAVWIVVILIGTSWPSISVGPDDIIGFDKMVHFTMYAISAVLMGRAFDAPLSGRVFALLLVGLSLFGAVDEWHQGFIPGRSTSFYDWVADTLGVLVGLLFVRHYSRTTPPRQEFIT